MNSSVTTVNKALAKNSVSILFRWSFILPLLLAVFYSTGQAQESAGKPRFEKNIIKETFKFTADTKASIPLEELKQGCPARDCIPAIDKPKFMTVADASFLKNDDVVIVASYQNINKIYSRNILESHEIVNDWLGSLPVAVTFCPLCGSAVAVVRVVDGKVSEFGVSGVLHNSDLVMYDRNTQSLWGQITATSIVGTKTGTKLRKIPALLMTWQQARETYPDAEVLSTDTGYDYQYDKAKYQNYYDSDRVVFPVSLSDARANSKEIVYGISVNGESIAFTESYLEKHKDFDQPLANRTIHIVNKGNGVVTATDKKTAEALPVTHVYWFAWYNFHPGTVLLGGTTTGN